MIRALVLCLLLVPSLAMSQTIVLPKGTLIQAPNQDPVRLTQVRFAITRAALDDALVALQTQKNLETSLAECVVNAEKLQNQKKANWWMVGASATAAAVVLSFIAGAVAF